MRHAILGAGGVGGLVGGALAKAGHPVTLRVRPGRQVHYSEWVSVESETLGSFEAPVRRRTNRYAILCLRPLAPPPFVVRWYDRSVAWAGAWIEAPEGRSGEGCRSQREKTLMNSDALIEEINAAYRWLSAATEDLARADRELGYPTLTKKVRRILNKALNSENHAGRLRTDWEHVWMTSKQ
jgi:hypothetical protein